MPDALYPKDLSDLGELSTAEKQVLEAVANGKTLELGTDVPEQPRDEVTVRAGLIRLLATGGCEGAEVHPLGVFSLSGSHIAGLDAPGIVVVNDLTLRDGFRCKGTVDLTHAEVGGQFDLSQGVFMNPDANALLAQWIKVGGSVFLKDGFSAEGEVSFLGARIDGQFSVVRAYLSDDHSHAFSGQNMRVGEIFYWRDVAVNDGTVLLTGARVGALADDAKSWPEDRVMMDGFVYDRLVYADTTLATLSTPALSATRTRLRRDGASARSGACADGNGAPIAHQSAPADICFGIGCCGLSLGMATGLGGCGGLLCRL